MKEKIGWTIYYIAFVLSGVLWICMGLFLLPGEVNFQKNAEPVRAEIVNIETYYEKTFKRNSVGTHYEARHNVYVTFTFNDQLYENVKLGYWSFDMEVGDKISILCNPNNPRNIGMNDESSVLIYISVILGGIVFILFGVMFGRKFFIDDKRKKDLLVNGRTIEATVTSVYELAEENKEGIHPYCITCSYEGYTFKTDPIWEKSISFQYDVGDTIEVIVDPEDYTMYRFELQEK